MEKENKNEVNEPTENNTVETTETDTDDTGMEASAELTDLNDLPEGEEPSMEQLMSLYEESFKQFAKGEVVTGRIISDDKNKVYKRKKNKIK